MAIRHILVAVKDPEAKWSPAVAKAAQIARTTGASVELFHAVDTRMYVGALDTFPQGEAGFDAQEAEPFRQKLELLARKLRRHRIAVCTGTVVDHPVYEAILRQAALVGADLIVTDCHGGSHLAPSLLHLTDWELARLSPVPVLIVRERPLYRRPVVLCAVDPAHEYAKPAGLDPRILAAGREISHALHGVMHAVHAFRSIAPGAEVSNSACGASAKMDAVAATDAEVSLNKLLRPMAADIPQERRHLVGGNPAEAIVQTVARIRAGILVLGSVSRTGLKRLLVGNTAERLLYRLPCDMLVVKPDDFECRVTQQIHGARLIVTPACN